MDPGLGTLNGTGKINSNVWLSSPNGNIHIRGRASDALGNSYGINCLFVLEDGVIYENKIDIK